MNNGLRNKEIKMENNRTRRKNIRESKKKMVREIKIKETGERKKKKMMKAEDFY